MRRFTTVGDSRATRSRPWTAPGRGHGVRPNPNPRLRDHRDTDQRLRGRQLHDDRWRESQLRGRGRSGDGNRAAVDRFTASTSLYRSRPGPTVLYPGGYVQTLNAPEASAAAAAVHRRAVADYRPAPTTRGGRSRIRRTRLPRRTLHAHQRQAARRFAVTRLPRVRHRRRFDRGGRRGHAPADVHRVARPGHARRRHHEAHDERRGRHRGSDYTALSNQSFSIPAGLLSNTFTVTVNGDRPPEASERFDVTLSSPVGVFVVDGVATGTITDDDAHALVCADLYETDGDVSCDRGPERRALPGRQLLASGRRPYALATSQPRALAAIDLATGSAAAVGIPAPTARRDRARSRLRRAVRGGFLPAARRRTRSQNSARSIPSPAPSALSGTPRRQGAVRAPRSRGRHGVRGR